MQSQSSERFLACSHDKDVGYDNAITIFNIRDNTCNDDIMGLKHGSPVNTLKYSPWLVRGLEARILFDEFVHFVVSLNGLHPGPLAETTWRSGRTTAPSPSTTSTPPP